MAMAHSMLAMFRLLKICAFTASAWHGESKTSCKIVLILAMSRSVVAKSD